MAVMGRRRAAARIRHSSQAVPHDEHDDEDRAVEDRLLDAVGQEARQHGRTEDDRDDRRRDEEDLAPAGLAADAPQPRSAPAGMPIGATRTLPAWAAPRRVTRPVFGRWKVTVRSAWTAGSDGSPLDRSIAVGVSTATTGMPAARARTMSSTADRIGSRSGPRTPVPSSASTMTAAFSIPWPKIATSRATGAWTLAMPDVAGDAVPVLGGRGARRVAPRWRRPRPPPGRR